jgi:hypothetical protein
MPRIVVTPNPKITSQDNLVSITQSAGVFIRIPRKLLFRGYGSHELDTNAWLALRAIFTWRSWRPNYPTCIVPCLV